MSEVWKKVLLTSEKWTVLEEEIEKWDILADIPFFYVNF